MRQDELIESEESEKVLVLLDNLPLPENILGPDPSRALIESIRRDGFEGALRLSRLPNGELVARGGGRRIKALWILRDEGQSPFADASYAVAAFVRDYTGPEDSLASLADNGTARPNHVARYLALRNLQDAGVGEKTIAAQTGLAVGTIRQTLKLRALLPDLLNGLLHGDISYTAALKLAGMTREQQERAVNMLDEKGELTIAQVNGLRRVQADASMEEFLEQGGMFDAPQTWQLIVDAAGGTATVVLPAGETRIMNIDDFMRFIEEEGN